MTNVVQFPGSRPSERGGKRGLRGVLRRHAREIGDILGDEIAGFVVIGIAEDGCYSMGVRLPKSISPMLGHSLLNEILRRELVTAREIEHVLRRRHLVEDEE